MKINKFKMTEAWQRRLLQLLTDNGMMQVFIERTGTNTFKIYAGCEDTKILEMDAIKMRPGDTQRLDHVYVVPEWGAIDVLAFPPEGPST